MAETEVEMENAELRGIIKRLRQKIEARINKLEEIEYKKGIDLTIVRAQITECEIFLSLMDAETAGSVNVPAKKEGTKRRDDDENGNL